MSVQYEITEAIREAVREAGEAETLSNHIIAWFEAIVRGNTDLENTEDTLQRMESLYSSMSEVEED